MFTGGGDQVPLRICSIDKYNRSVSLKSLFGAGAGSQLKEQKIS
ncbi:MAG TPA: hypothetical protein VEW92_01875 [Nitrososphaeraceae archaeon]|nr:hypothetical protein [Nitrososphaeraceae archaeon]